PAWRAVGTRAVLHHDHGLAAAAALRGRAFVAGRQQHGLVEGEIDVVFAGHGQDRLAVGGGPGAFRGARRGLRRGGGRGGDGQGGGVWQGEGSVGQGDGVLPVESRRAGRGITGRVRG